MNVSLVYKSTAGEGLSPEELTERLERCGHRVLRAIDADADLSNLVSPDVDLVVAAGGDGTIAEAAKALAHTDVPLAILPRGTANNIAKSFGAQGALPELIESWKHAIPKACDLGTIRLAKKEFLFVEGAGAGLIAEGIVAADQRNGVPHPDVAAQIAADLRHYRNALEQLRPRPFQLSVDGHDVSGDYLLVEVLNIPSVGSNIVLSDEVSPFDGLLSVITAREEHRQVLVTYFEERLSGAQVSATLPSIAARRIELSGAAALHVDDEIHQIQPSTRILVEVEPGAINVLVGPSEAV